MSKIVIDKGLVCGDKVVLGYNFHAMAEIVDYDTRVFGYWFFNDDKWLDKVFEDSLICFWTQKDLMNPDMTLVVRTKIEKLKKIERIDEGKINGYLMRLSIQNGRKFTLCSRQEVKDLIDNRLRTEDYKDYYSHLLQGAYNSFKGQNRERLEDCLYKLDMSRMSKPPEYGLYATKRKYANGTYAYVTDNQKNVEIYKEEAKDINEEFKRFLRAACKRYD